MKSFKQVMLIDDDEMMLLICERLMKVSGFTNDIITFSQAQPAKEYLEETLISSGQIPDIIFVDLMLNYYRKWEFLDWFQSWTAENKIMIPLYVMSSSINTEDKDGALAYNFVKEFLVKPLTQEDFARIRKENS